MKSRHSVTGLMLVIPQRQAQRTRRCKSSEIQNVRRPYGDEQLDSGSEREV